MKLLIFDFDGIIVDTETPDYESWQEVFGAHGCELTLDAWEDCIGKEAGVFDPCAHLEELLGRRLDAETIHAARHDRYIQLIHEQPLRRGLTEYLDAAPRLGLQCAIASSASRDWVEGHLDRFGIRPRFDCIRTYSDVPRAKPNPDLFLAVLEAMDTAPRDALVFEDSPNGIRAARRAGIPCVAVPNPVTRRLPLDDADFQIDGFDALPLDALLARFE